MCCSGDYGIGFLGHSHNAGAYLLFNQLGVDWLCFLCNHEVITQAAANAYAPTNSSSTAPGNVTVNLTPTDSYHRRVYIQPLGLYLVAEAGVFETVQIDFGRQTVNVSFAALADTPSSRVRLRVEAPAKLQSPGPSAVWIAVSNGVRGPCQQSGDDLSLMHGHQKVCCPNQSCMQHGRLVDQIHGTASDVLLKKWQAKSEVTAGEGYCKRSLTCVRGAFELFPCDRTSIAWLLLEWHGSDRYCSAVS